jgi:cysteine desulfurase/selenocysteine lyase
MTFKPESVLEAMARYYHEFPSCHGRSDHFFGRETTRAYDMARSRVQRFLNAAHPEEIVFVRNTTEAINLVAHTFPLEAGDCVLSSDIEHNSNLLPWQGLARKKGVERRLFPTRGDTTFDIEGFRSRMDPKVKLISVLHTSNLSGISFPLEEIVGEARKIGALVLVDGAQALMSHSIDVRALDIDFFACSFHKAFGPTGIGFLYGKKYLLDSMPPFLLGGETVKDTTYEGADFALAPDRFEAGLQNYAGAIGGAAALDFIEELGQDAIAGHVAGLNRILSDRVSRLAGVRIIGPENPDRRGSILNLFIQGIPVRDVARILNDAEGIMIRAGRHCVHSWYNANKHPESLRFSFSVYNTAEEADLAGGALEKVLKFFGK